MTLPTFIINLPAHERRHRFMEMQMEFFPELHPRFVAGIDGRTLSDTELAEAYDEAKAKSEWGRALSRAEVGCALSHLHVYQNMVDEGIRQALVLEDSALLGGLFPEVIEALEDKADTHRAAVTLLSPVLRYSLADSAPLTRWHRLATLRHGARLGVAYVINRPAAHAFLDHCRPVWAPADAWERGLKAGWVELLAVVPYCISLNAEAIRHSAERLQEAPGPQWTPAPAKPGWLQGVHKFFGVEEKVPRTW